MEIFFWLSVERKQVSAGRERAAKAASANGQAGQLSFNARAHKRQAMFHLSKAGGENSLFTHDWGKSANRTLFSADFIFPIDQAAIPEYGYGNSNPKPLSMERHNDEIFRNDSVAAQSLACLGEFP